MMLEDGMSTSASIYISRCATDRFFCGIKAISFASYLLGWYNFRSYMCVNVDFMVFVE